MLLGIAAETADETDAKLPLGESLSTGIVDFWITCETGCEELPSEEVDALLNAGLAAGVSNIDAMALAGVLLTLLRGNTGLKEH